MLIKNQTEFCLKEHSTTIVKLLKEVIVVMVAILKMAKLRKDSELTLELLELLVHQIMEISQY
jgi:hypothetical protein